MNKDFVKTQVTLLRKIAAEKAGEDEATWARFFELYYPAMEAFARRLGGGDHAEDVAQEVLVKLVGILRDGQYERRSGKSFRGYVKTLLRNCLNDLYRRERARGLGRTVELDASISESTVANMPDAGETLDAEWVQACYDAAREHVLTKTAVSAQSKAVYRAYVIDGKSADEVSAQYGISKNSVSQIKTRIDRMITAKLAELGN